MAKKQTRSSISINQLLMARIREEAVRDDVTVSHWLTTIVLAELEKRGRPFNVALHHEPRAVVKRATESKLRYHERRETRRAA